MEKKIPYISRNYDDYRSALVDLSKKYYPELDFNFDDASVGSWFLDMNAAIADELSYHIDRAFQETNIDSARKSSSLFTMARNMGFKVPGPKGSMCEVAFRCVLPVEDESSTSIGPMKRLMPVIKKGTKVTSGSQTFELLEELDFSKQFSVNGVSNRLVQPIRDSNSKIISYYVTKFAVVVAGETSIYKKYISSDDVTPFMEILLPAENVMNVESIIVKEGSSFQSNPTLGEFYMPQEVNGKVKRFFEVDSLSQQEIWTDKINPQTNKAQVYEYSYAVNEDDATYYYPVYSVTKGEWKPVEHKFVTEYTDNGYLKITFGSGVEGQKVPRGSSFAEYQMSKMMRSDSLGVLPNPDTTVFILYRSGGGKASNLPKGAVNSISYLNAEITGDGTPEEKGRVIASITVESTTESVSGKDMPSVDELKHLIKFSTASQERCVTLKDYVSRVQQLPAKYGCPFRVGAIEENNKVMLYLLGVNSAGELDKSLPVVMVENIQQYLSRYRMINDLVEIKPGRIFNIQFEPYVIIDKDYNVCDVITSIRDVVTNYMDVNKRQMGDNVYVGDIAKEISKVDGVINLIKLKVWGIHDGAYSTDRIEQDTLDPNDCCGDGVVESNREEIDLEASDGIIYSRGDSMIELKRPNEDILIKYKQR